MHNDSLVSTRVSGAGLNPPVVSLVLINWNYAPFVGAAIDSIKRQDYPRVEAIVVDNGSTDNSRDVIARHVADDPRFRVVHLEENLGQLGAFLDVFEELKGDFVTIVDADDILFPSFVSSHVQTHLALPHSAAITSSNVVEMSAASRLLTGSYVGRDLSAQPITQGLRRIDAAVRLSTISDADYLELSEGTCTIIGHGGWIWAPGTSNMFRRSVLNLVYFEPKVRAHLRAADSYLCPICHVFGGSAFIDVPLSGYRLHGNNYYAERESIYGVPKGRQNIIRYLRRETLETIGVVLSRADRFTEIFGDERYWSVVDQIALPIRRLPGRRMPLEADGATPFADNYEHLVEVFGEGNLLGQLRKRLSANDLRRLLQEKRDGWIPPRLRWTLLKQHVKSAWRRKSAWLRNAVSPRPSPRSKRVNKS